MPFFISLLGHMYGTLCST